MSTFAKKDLAVMQHLTEVVYGKSEVSIKGCYRTHSYNEEYNYISAWLLQTTDSFFIRSNHYYDTTKSLYSDDEFDYHYVEYDRYSWYQDSIKQHVSFSFSKDPSWFNVTEDGNVYWLSTGNDTMTYHNGIFVTESEPAIYRMRITNDEIEAVRSWEYQPFYKKIIAIRPFYFSPNSTTSNPISEIFITTEVNNFGDTFHLFHQNTNGFGPYLVTYLNHPDEIKAAEKGSFIIEPQDTVVVKSILGDYKLTPSDSAACFYSFSLDQSSHPQFNKIELPNGSKINEDIVPMCFAYIPNGDSSIIDNKKVYHKPNDIVHYFYNQARVLRPSSPCSETIDLNLNSYIIEDIFINDAIDSVTAIYPQQFPRKINFDDGITKLSRSLSSSYNSRVRRFEYLNCEITSNVQQNRNLEELYQWNHFVSLLYNITDFSDSSTLTIIEDFDQKQITLQGSYTPTHIYNTVYYWGSVREYNKVTVSLYPNPTSGTLNFASSNNSNLQGFYFLSDIQGNVVDEGRNNTNVIKLPQNISNGLYYITLKTESNKVLYTGKFILNRD